MLSASSSTIFGNSGSSGYGGGIYNGGTAAVSSSTISMNSADYGGGIYNQGTLTVSGNTISKNSGKYGGGIYSGGTATVSDSIISGNSALTGGGIYDGYPGNLFIDGTAQITNNQANKGYGDGIYTDSGSVTLDGTKIAVKSNKAHLPYPLPTWTPWYDQYDVYMTATPTTTGGFDPATQVTGNTHI
jgi:hypothetical protein